jgi:hypothetical protein
MLCLNEHRQRRPLSELIRQDTEFRSCRKGCRLRRTVTRNLTQKQATASAVLSISPRSLHLECELPLAYCVTEPISVLVLPSFQHCSLLVLVPLSSFRCPRSVGLVPSASFRRPRAGGLVPADTTNGSYRKSPQPPALRPVHPGGSSELTSWNDSCVCIADSV